MKKAEKPLKDLTDRELLEWNTNLNTHKEHHLDVIQGWVQFLGWTTIVSIILTAIILNKSAF